MQKFWQVWPASLCRWQWPKPNMITKSSFCLHALSQFWICFEFTYCLRWNQALSRDVYSEKFITMHHIHFWDCIMPQWLRCLGREHIPLLTVHKSPHRKKKILFEWVWSLMGRLLQRNLPFLATEWSRKHPSDPHEPPSLQDQCVFVCVCLTESGYSIPLEQSSRGHHLLAVRDLGGDHCLSRTKAPCLF